MDNIEQDINTLKSLFGDETLRVKNVQICNTAEVAFMFISPDGSDLSIRFSSAHYAFRVLKGFNKVSISDKHLNLLRSKFLAEDPKSPTASSKKKTKTNVQKSKNGKTVKNKKPTNSSKKGGNGHNKLTPEKKKEAKKKALAEKNIKMGLTTRYHRGKWASTKDWRDTKKIDPSKVVIHEDNLSDRQREIYGD